MSIQSRVMISQSRAMMSRGPTSTGSGLIHTDTMKGL